MAVQNNLVDSFIQPQVYKKQVKLIQFFKCMYCSKGVQLLYILLL